MKWENFNLHVENLFPGLISLFLIIYRYPNLIDFDYHGEIPKILSNDFVTVGVFIASAYTLGILAVAVSRLLLDALSENTTRQLILKMFLYKELKGKSRQFINEDYRNKLSKVLSSDNETIINEVLQRRERGRLLRTTFVPSILALILYSDSSIFFLIIYCLSILIGFLSFYSYTEYSIYAECKLLNTDNIV